MAVLTREDEPILAAASPTSGPVLRIRRRGEEQAGTVPLAAGKCTIGSSAQCNVCLPSPEVRPLQCLLTIDGGVVVATRWAAGVLLNGKDFAKAKLVDGDRLAIGSWELSYKIGPSSSQAGRAVSRQETSFNREVEPWSERPVAVEPRPKPIQTVPAAAAAAAVTSQPPCEPAAIAPRALSSHAFADRLVLDLWTANFRTRRRAKALINGLRAARFQADAMAADLSAMETELDLARAAYDSQAAHDERLKLEVAEQRLSAEQRVTPLLEELASLRVQLDRAQADLARQTAELNRLTAKPAAERAPAEAPRANSDLPSNDPWIGVTPAVASVASTPLAWAAFEQPLDQSTAQLSSEPLAAHDDTSFVCGLERAAAAPEVVAELMAPVAEAPAATRRGQSFDRPSPPRTEPSPSDEAPVAPWTAPVAEQPAAEYSSTSFIDKYRHLLEEDPSSPAPAPAGRLSPVLDDEFLSPAKAETCASPADDSDEALEAYMANMMRRVRSAAPSYDSSQAPSAEPSPSSTLAQLLASGSAAAPLAEPGAGANALAEQPFDFEAFRQAARKPGPVTDLAALREIANNSARTAIASHRQRKNHESAVSKIAIGLTALASSAYLMASAPAADGWIFWAGAFTGAIGITSAIQVLLIERRRARDSCPATSGSSRG